MTEMFRAIRDLKWLLVGVCALVVGTLAVHAQKPNPTQTSAPPPEVKVQAMAAQAQAQPQATPPAPSPTPTPINWSEDPMLKRFVFRIGSSDQLMGVGVGLGAGGVA